MGPRYNSPDFVNSPAAAKAIKELMALPKDLTPEEWATCLHALAMRYVQETTSVSDEMSDDR